MNAYVRFVWKRWFSSKRNIVLLGLLVAIELVSLQMMSGMDQFTDPVPMSDPEAVMIRPLKRKEQFSMLSAEKKDEAYELIAQSEKDLEFLQNNLEKADLAKQHKDWPAYLQESIVNFLMLARLEEISEATSFHEQDFIHEEQLEKLYEKYDVVDLAKYRSIANLPMGHSMYPVYEKYVRYFDYLEQRQLEPASMYDVSSGTVFIQLARSILPCAAVVLVGFLFWQTKKDRKAQKMLLTIPYFKNRFAAQESLARISMAGFCLLVPAGIMSIGLGIAKGWTSWNTPVFVFGPGLRSFAVPYEQITNGMSMVPIGISTLNGTTYVEPAMELMPCWQVCVLVLLLGALFVSFLVQYEMFLEKVVNASFLSTVLYFVSAGLLLVLPGGWWDPLRYADPVAVLCGNAGVSYLSGLCVLDFYTLVLFLLNGLLIRKHA